MSTSCESCTYFDEKHANVSKPTEGAGLCRFNPPVSQPGPDAHGLWPVVTEKDWCGHYASQGQAAVHAA